MRSLKHFASLLFAGSISGAAMVPAATAARTGDACALLTPAQVGAALGVSVGAGTYVIPTFKKTCTWNATTTGSGYVTLMLQEVGGFEGKQLGQMASKNMSLMSISGVGDDAYYLAVGDQIGLIVKKGSSAFKVAVYAHIPVESKKGRRLSPSKCWPGSNDRRRIRCRWRVNVRPLFPPQWSVDFGHPKADVRDRQQRGNFRTFVG
jgi:hypothetical protein